MKTQQKTFSIAIPVYEMNGKGVEFLEFNFNIFARQTFKDFEVVISDDSKDNEIKDLCQKWQDKITINYYKNEQNNKGLSTNTNNALKNSNGKWIKILFQDDYLHGDDALENLYNHIQKHTDNQWFATASNNVHDSLKTFGTIYPKYNKCMYLGDNTIGTPSVITIKNIANKLLFNKNFIWLMDVEYYKRMFDLYGDPCYFNNINVACRFWNLSTSATLDKKAKQHEVKTSMQECFLDYLNINEALNTKIDLLIDQKLTALEDIDIIYTNTLASKKPIIECFLKNYIRNNPTPVKYNFGKVSSILMLYFVDSKVRFLLKKVKFIRICKRKFDSLTRGW